MFTLFFMKSVTFDAIVTNKSPEVLSPPPMRSTFASFSNSNEYKIMEKLSFTILPYDEHSPPKRQPKEWKNDEERKKVYLSVLQRAKMIYAF